MWQCGEHIDVGGRIWFHRAKTIPSYGLQALMLSPYARSNTNAMLAEYRFVAFLGRSGRCPAKLGWPVARLEKGLQGGAIPPAQSWATEERSVAPGLSKRLDNTLAPG